MNSLVESLKNVSIKSTEPKVVRELADLSSSDKEAILDSTSLAFDCEGVDLGRDGEISLVMLSTPDQTYLFDVDGFDKNADIIPFLKEVLENPAIIKIIHDVRMDSDALYHILGISVIGVYDTQAWDMALTHHRNRNLNDTLMAYGCPINSIRDHSVYNTNFRFWATRPLTPQMIAWASEDVANLFLLKQKQTEKASSMSRPVDATAESERLACFIRDMPRTTKLKISSYKVGKFIGTRGSNIESLTELIPGTFFQKNGKRTDCSFILYSTDADAETKMLSSIKCYQ